MKFELKPLSRESIERSLAKADRYRLLNEPEQAESICRDILRIDPGNQQVLVTLLLALTEQFSRRWADATSRAGKVLEHLEDPYEKVYYAGLVAERKARAKLKQHIPGADHTAYRFLREAMELFEEAEKQRPKGNDDPILRYNSCARTIMDASLKPSPEDDFIPLLE